MLLTLPTQLLVSERSTCNSHSTECDGSSISDEAMTGVDYHKSLFCAILQYASMDFIRDQLMWLVFATLRLAGLVLITSDP